MASSTEVEELESWEDLTDEILDRNLAKMKAITTAEKPSVEQSPTTVLLDSNDFRSRFLNQHNTPAVKILKRPNAQMTSQGAQMSQCADGDGREGQKPHRKSLQQREMEYAQARLRILGQAHCEEEKEPTFQERVRQIQNKTTSPSANSDATISTTNHLTSTLSPQSPAFVSHNHNHMATATTTVHTAPQFANSAVNHNGTLYYAAVPFQGQQSPNSGGVQSSVAYVGNNGPLNYTYGSNGLLATDPTAGLQMLSINPVQTTVGGTAGYQTVGNSAGYSTVGNSCCCSTVGNSGAVPTVGNRVNVITRFDASSGLQMIGVNTGVIFDSNGTVISVGSPAQVNMPGNSQRIPTLAVKPVQTTVGNSAGYSTVGNSAGYSTVGNPCSFTTVGNSAGYSTVGNPCSCTTVGNSAGYSTVGNSVGYSTVGSSVGFSTVSYPGCCTTVANTSSFSTVGVPTVTNSSAETVSGPKFVHPNHESFNNQKTGDQKKAAGLKSVEVIRQPKGPDGTKGFQFNMRR